VGREAAGTMAGSFGRLLQRYRDVLGEDELSRFMTEGASLNDDLAVAEAMLI